MSTTDDLLKLVGIGAIGVIGIGIVLVILAVMCVFVGVFILAVSPPTPSVTISPYDGYPSTTPDYQYYASTPTPDMYGGYVIYNETQSVVENHYQYYSIIMQSGDKIDVSVSTDGSLVDAMLVDSNNFGKYVTAVNNPNSSGWKNYVSGNSIVTKNFSFTAPYTDRYYVIIDNTKFPANGANAGKDVDVYTTVTLLY
jgi:hypothetical protein